MSDNLKEREAFEEWFLKNQHARFDTTAYIGWMAWQARAAIEADRVSRDVPAGWKLAQDWKGYALLGTGHYVINHTADFDEKLGAELLITMATDDDRSGNRQIGESRDVSDQKPIESDQMVIRIGFLNERGLFALEDQLRYIRQIHFAAASQPQPVHAQPSGWQPMTPAQRRLLIDAAGDKTDGLNQDDFADEIVLSVERHFGIRKD